MQKTIIFSCAMLAASLSFAQDTQIQVLQAQAQDLARTVKQEIENRVVFNTQDGPNTFVFVGGQMFNGNPVKGQPYSADAVNETTQTLADGNHIVNRSSSSIYRDSEGRERREESIGKLGSWNAQGEPAKVVFISDPVAKASYTLHPNDHTAERMPGNTITITSHDGPVDATKRVQKLSLANTISGDSGPVTVGVARRGAGDGASSTKTEQLAPQMIEGVMAQGTRTTTVIPAGQIGNERDINIVSERWFSTELGVVVMSKQSDPRSGDTVYKLTNINRSEPQHSLFEIPSDYAISDGAMMKKLAAEEKARRAVKEEQ